MKKTKGRLTAILMVLAMAFTMIPMMGNPTHAAGRDSNELVFSDNTITVQVIAGETTWLKQGSNGMGVWFGLNDKENIFPEGSVFWERWINKESDPEAWANYYGMLDESHRKRAKQDRLWIFLCGVKGPDGTEIHNFGGKTADFLHTAGSRLGQKRC